TEGLTDRELDVAAEESGDGLGSALSGNHLDLEPVIGEDALVDRCPQGAGFGDGQRCDADLRDLVWRGAGIARRCVGSSRVGATGQGEGGCGQQAEGGKTLLHGAGPLRVGSRRTAVALASGGSETGTHIDVLTVPIVCEPVHIVKEILTGVENE